MVQQQNNTLSWVPPRRDLEQRKPWILYSYNLSTQKSGVISSCRVSECPFTVPSLLPGAPVTQSSTCSCTPSYLHGMYSSTPRSTKLLHKEPPGWWIKAAKQLSRLMWKKKMGKSNVKNWIANHSSLFSRNPLQKVWKTTQDTGLQVDCWLSLWGTPKQDEWPL